MVDCASSGGWPHTRVHVTELTGLSGLRQDDVRLGGDLTRDSMESWRKNEGFYIITVHYIHAKIIKE